MKNLLEQFKDFAVNNLCVSPIDAESMCDWLREMLEKKQQGVVFPIGWDVDMRRFYNA